LIDSGFDINRSTAAGTSLHVAAINGKFGCVRYLLQVDEIMIIQLYFHYVNFNFSIKNGADCNIQTADGSTAQDLVKKKVTDLDSDFYKIYLVLKGM